MATAENVRRGMRAGRGATPGDDRVRRSHRRGRGGARPARAAVGREHRRRHQVRAARAAPRAWLHRHRRRHARAWASAPTPRSSASCAACCSSRCRTATATGSCICGSRPTAPGGENISFSVPEVSDFRHGAPVVRRHRRVLAVDRHRSEQTEGATRINVGLVTGNFFDVMGLSPVLGRLTRPSDDGPGVPAGDGADARVLDEALRRRPEHRRQAGQAGRQVRRP